MGQQQLLLMVIGIVIVAVAVLAGLFAMQQGIKNAQADNLLNRNLAIATEAVFWKTKRDPYAGGNASYAGLSTNGLDKLYMDAETDHGDFAITSATASAVVITGVSKNYPEIGVRTYVNGYDVDSSLVRYDGSITIE